MLDYWFIGTKQGLFTWLAIVLKQEVYVCYNMQQLLPIGIYIPNYSVVLDNLDRIYDEILGIVLWKARFCLENFNVILVTGPVLYLV